MSPGESVPVVYGRSWGVSPCRSLTIYELHALGDFLINSLETACSGHSGGVTAALEGVKSDKR